MKSIPKKWIKKRTKWKCDMGFRTMNACDFCVLFTLHTLHFLCAAFICTIFISTFLHNKSEKMQHECKITSSLKCTFFSSILFLPSFHPLSMNSIDTQAFSTSLSTSSSRSLSLTYSFESLTGDDNVSRYLLSRLFSHCSVSLKS